MSDVKNNFEAWARSIGKDDRDLMPSSEFKNQYAWRTEQQMWEAWQAATLQAAVPVASAPTISAPVETKTTFKHTQIRPCDMTQAQLLEATRLLLIERDCILVQTEASGAEQYVKFSLE